MELGAPPRLVVLTACLGAGPGTDVLPGDEGAMAAIGPRIAEAGIPAVLAFQGRVSVGTVKTFLTRFFAELVQDGHVDRAASVARGVCAVAQRHDRWSPVLFSRISHGRIWSLPNQVPRREKQFDGWDGLINAIDEGTCTPILGPGLLEGLIGPTRELARQWALAVEFAMATYHQEDLPRVAQFISTLQGREFPRKQIGKRYLIEVRRRFRPESEGVAAGVLSETAEALEAVLVEAWGRQQRKGRAEPHTILAELPFPIYVTTNVDNLLERALQEAQKDRRRALKPEDQDRALTGTESRLKYDICRWHHKPKTVWPPSPFSNTSYEPNAVCPLVFHLYGRMDYPRSLVLTEDDYFDYLIGVNRDHKSIPLRVKSVLQETALVFLGFRLDDWDFRVLFRSILAQADQEELDRNYPHVAVQLEPEEGRNVDPEKARRYLQKYFQDVDISIYWGSVEDFARDLRDNWNRTFPKRRIGEP
jgi:SIR2-like domain/CHAT domain